jgi:superfamily II DNA or RNA helicase
VIFRDYQARMIDRAKNALENKGDTLCSAPTGAGKTIILSGLAGAMQPAKTLILQHRDELTEQNLSKFQKVNPGLSVGLFNAVAKSWRGKATFAMVQTLCRERNLSTIPKLDLMIIDECHHAAAESYMEVIGAAKDRNPDLMIAGFTATPSRGDGKGLRAVFSNVADQITLKELISKGFLVRPRAFIVDVNGVKDDLAKVRKLRDDYDMNQVSEIMNKIPINEEVVRKWKELGENRRTIIFCSTVAHAESVRDAFAREDIYSELITGEMGTVERAGVYRRLKTGKTRVVVNVAVLTEGFDEPAIGCVVLLRPCSQKSTMIQMIGRGLRVLNPDEYPGEIKRDCIVIDFGNSIRTHGNVDAEVNLDKKEKREGEAPVKICPECGADVPIGMLVCICGFEFITEDGPGPAEVVLTEYDLLNASPFRWVDLFGSGKVMLASGFEAWSAVVSPDGENWFALGKLAKERKMNRLLIGEKTQAIAAADDFLRTFETGASAKKSRRWLQDPATQKQAEHLKRMGYDVDPFGFSFTKYSATAHLQFQWNRALIENAMRSSGLLR